MKIMKRASVRIAMTCLALMAAVISNSCKEEAVSTADLLSTVPSSAGMVVGVNTQSVLTKAGCKVDGVSITPGKEVTAWIDSWQNVDDSKRAALKMILSGESGVNPSAAIIFTDAYNTYLTAMLADTDKFLQFVETQTGSRFEDAGNDVKVCDNVAVKGAQCWVCVSSRNTIDANAVASYAAISSERSFMANPYSKNISEMTSDIAGWCDIKLLARDMFSRGSMSTLNLAAGMLFENASALAFDVKFNKGEGVAMLNILNEKGEPAKYLLPSSKIDVATVESIGGNAEALVAISITKDFTKKIEKIGSALGGNMFGMFTEAMKPIDGTMAFALGNLNDMESSVAGVVTTDGNTPREFMSFLSQFGSTQVDGKHVRLSKGAVTGSLDVAKVAEDFKGAVAGVAVDMKAKGEERYDMFGTATFVLMPDGSGLKCKIDITTSDPDKNILLSLIEDDTKNPL